MVLPYYGVARTSNNHSKTFMLGFPDYQTSPQSRTHAGMILTLKVIKENNVPITMVFFGFGSVTFENTCNLIGV